MTTKLVSANMGIVLIVEKDGKQETKQFSIVFPSSKARQPNAALYFLRQFLCDEFEIDVERHSVQIVTSKKLKPTRPISQKEFNKKIKALGY